MLRYILTNIGAGVHVATLGVVARRMQKASFATIARNGPQYRSQSQQQSQSDDGATQNVTIATRNVRYAQHTGTAQRRTEKQTYTDSHSASQRQWHKRHHTNRHNRMKKEKRRSGRDRNAPGDERARDSDEADSGELHKSLHSLNQKVRNGVKQITITYNAKAQQHEATLVLDGAGELIARGTGPSQKVARRMCAADALRIFDSLKNNKAQQGQVVTAADGESRPGGSTCDSSTSQAASDDTPSAPLIAVVASMGAQRAQLFRMASLLFDVPPPKTHFRKVDARCCHQRSRNGRKDASTHSSRDTAYVCKLEWNGVACEGKGLNRFEAERMALRHALSSAEVHDERMQTLRCLLAQHPEIDAAGIPAAVLPQDIRERIAQCVGMAKQSISNEENGTLPVASNAPTTGSSDTASVVKPSPDSDTFAGSNASYAQSMRDRLCALRAHPDYLHCYHQRRCSLPMAAFAERVVQTVESHRVTIICGTTGCGKTTQVPQYLLDAAIMRGQGDCCNILVTQPRRLSTFGVAERIAQERLSCVGDDVGYVVRLEAKPGRHLTLCTSGTLLQMLTSQPALERVSHLIVDEVHERDVNCDMILALTKKILERNANLRVVLMSATMQADIFARYFGNAPVIEVEGAAYTVREQYLEDIARSARMLCFRSNMFALCNDVDNVEQRQQQQCDALRKSQNSDDEHTCLYRDDDSCHAASDIADTDMLIKTPTTPHIAEERSNKQHRRLLVPAKTDYNLVAFLVYRSVTHDLEGCVDGKSILIFLPGWRELLAAKQAIEEFAHGRYADVVASMLSCLPVSTSIVERGQSHQSLRFHIILLHSSVDAAKQRECFAPAPAGFVKVVLATNIAESGITIDDAAVVIDTGLLKQTEWACRSRSVPRSRRANDNADAQSVAHDCVVGAASTAASLNSDSASATAHNFTTQLSLGYASRANCTQRKGRAGRTQGGVCYRLFTRATWNALPSFTIAEIHRVALTQVLLRLLFLGYNTPRSTLQHFLEPPTSANVEASMQRLQDLGAVDADERLTPLGKYLSQLPCEPHIGKLIMLGAVLHCLDSALTVAATADANPFITDRDAAAEVRMKRYLFARDTESDHLSALNAYNAYCANGERRDFALANSLHYGNLLVISRYKEQYHQILRTSGFLSSDDAQRLGTNDSNSHMLYSAATFTDAEQSYAAAGCAMPRMYTGSMYIDCSHMSRDALDVSLVKACVCGSLFPNVAVFDVASSSTSTTQTRARQTRLALRTRTQRSITPAKDSACRRIGGPKAAVLPTCAEYVRTLINEHAAHNNRDGKLAAQRAALPAMFYVYEDIFCVQEACESFLRGVSSISMWALLLFGASEARMHYYEDLNLCVIDRWIAVRMDSETYSAMRDLRATLSRCIWQKYVDPHNARNNAVMLLLRKLSKEVLQLPLDAHVGVSQRLVDSGVIISPTALAEVDVRSSSPSDDRHPPDADDDCVDRRAALRATHSTGSGSKVHDDNDTEVSVLSR